MVISSGPLAPFGGAETNNVLGKLDGPASTVVEALDDDDEESNTTAGNIKRRLEKVTRRTTIEVRDENRL
jgi:hypothetical protein